LNLPPESKLVPAYFGMLWSEEIPVAMPGPGVSVDVIAGSVDGLRAPAPPPDSWAARPDTDLAIWLIRLDAGAQWDLPIAPASVNRMLHCFSGSDVRVATTNLGSGIGVRLRADSVTTVASCGEPAEFLLLQGRPIGAPVFQLGPFVMNSPEELRTAVADYRRTQFGGWPWSGPSPVHDRSAGRFAIHADGSVERRDLQPVVTLSDDLRPPRT
jgi:redox-sensitive bicupin YhaK (pirin superfamily)